MERAIHILKELAARTEPIETLKALAEQSEEDPGTLHADARPPKRVASRVEERAPASGAKAPLRQRRRRLILGSTVAVFLTGGVAAFVFLGMPQGLLPRSEPEENVTVSRQGTTAAKQALDQEHGRAEALARELASARDEIKALKPRAATKESLGQENTAAKKAAEQERARAEGTVKLGSVREQGLDLAAAVRGCSSTRRGTHRARC